VEKIAAEGKKAAAKVTQLQADLDHEAAVQQGREVEMERLRGESKVRERSSELPNDIELQAASSDLQRKDSKLQKKESELQSTRGELEEARQHIEVVEATL